MLLTPIFTFSLAHWATAEAWSMLCSLPRNVECEFELSQIIQQLFPFLSVCQESIGTESLPDTSAPIAYRVLPK